MPSNLSLMISSVVFLSLQWEPASVGDDAVLRCGHRLCHDERLLKLKVCIIRLGRIGLGEILWRLARDRLRDRWQIGARPSPNIGCATLVLQNVVQVGLVLRVETRHLLAGLRNQ